MENTGTLCAILTVSQYRTGDIHVSVISDLVWQYTKNLIGQVSPEEIAQRIEYLAKVFFKADITGDGAIDAKDIIAFNPLNATHRNALNFTYSELFSVQENGFSLMDCYRQNDGEGLIELFGTLFGNRLSLYEIKDSSNRQVKIEAVVFGDGNLISDRGGIDYEHDREANQNQTVAFFDQSAQDKVTITATPASGYEILSWEGCDSVSDDKTQCECALTTDHLVSVSFGHTETQLKQGVTLLDLANTITTISADQVTLSVTANNGDQDMVEALAGLAPGHFVVGPAGNGFLRKVATTEKISDYVYTITTEDASLEDIIAQGTGVFSKQMTHEDLAAATPSQVSTYGAASAKASTSGVSFAGIDGVRLLPPKGLNDRTFKLQIGNPLYQSMADGSTNTTGQLKSIARPNMQAEGLETGLKGAVTWKANDGTELTVKGEIALEINFETGASFGWTGLEYFKFIPEITSTESIDLSIGGKIDTPKDQIRKKICEINFTPIKFMIGPVPVWINPKVEVFIGANARIKAVLTTAMNFKQGLRGGIVYNRNAGINFFQKFTHSSEFEAPIANGTAEIKAFIQPVPEIKVYGVTGPEILTMGYLKIKGEISAPLWQNLQNDCEGGITFSAFCGLEAAFKWDLGKAGKIGNWLNISDLDLTWTIFKAEELLKSWPDVGTCEDTQPYMEVKGLDTEYTVAYGVGVNVISEFTVENAGGGQDMDWDVTYLEDRAISVFPTGGTLRKGESATVVATIDTSILKIGTSNNEIKFNNKYNPGLLAATPTGSTSRQIKIIVTPPPLSAPVLDTPEMAKNSA